METEENMSDWREFSAKTVDDAITNALVELQTTSDKIEYEVVEEGISRERLYFADEVFFSGTAAEVTPIRSIDHKIIGAGKRGPISEKLQKTFFDIVEGKKDDKFGWLDYI